MEDNLADSSSTELFKNKEQIFHTSNNLTEVMLTDILSKDDNLQCADVKIKIETTELESNKLEPMEETTCLANYLDIKVEEVNIPQEPIPDAFPSPEQVCVICYKVTDERIILFNAHTLKRATDILHIRQTFSLKFNNITLPRELNKTEGYHRCCYSNLTALSGKYKRRLDELQNEPSSSQDSVGEETSRMISSGEQLCTENILETSIVNDTGFCFFCNRERKKSRMRYQLLKSPKTLHWLKTIKILAKKIDDKKVLNQISAITAMTVLKYHSFCKKAYINKCQRIIDEKLSRLKGKEKKNIDADIVPTTEHISNNKVQIEAAQIDPDKELLDTLYDIDKNNCNYLFERCKEYNISAHQLKYLDRVHVWVLIPKTNLGVLAEFEYLLNEWKIRNGYNKSCDPFKGIMSTCVIETPSVLHADYEKS